MKISTKEREDTITKTVDALWLVQETPSITMPKDNKASKDKNDKTCSGNTRTIITRSLAVRRCSNAVAAAVTTKAITSLPQTSCSGCLRRTEPLTQKQRKSRRSKRDPGISTHNLHEGKCKTVVHPFPWKLHDLLDDVQADGNEHIVSWQHSGCSFAIFDQQLFVKRILPRYFCQTKYSSFKRQLNMYDFSRFHPNGSGGDDDRRGPYYYHEHFVRGRRDLIPNIIRRRIKRGHNVRRILPHGEETNFGKLVAKGISRTFPAAPPATLSSSSKESKKKGNKKGVLQWIRKHPSRLPESTAKSRKRKPSPTVGGALLPFAKRTRRLPATVPGAASRLSSRVAKGNHTSHGSVVVLPKLRQRKFSLDIFLNYWNEAESLLFGEMSTNEIEEGHFFRQANHCVDRKDSQEQTTAQYGRILPEAMMGVLEDVLSVRDDEVFLDIGHGIGNNVLQAAYCFGCEARGIELVGQRNQIAVGMKEKMEALRAQYMGKRATAATGNILFRHGRLEAEEHRHFLTDPNRVIKAFVNNFGGAFHSKSGPPLVMDHYIAGLFALMTPGSVLVSLDKLDLGMPLSNAQELCQKHGWPESTNASFFEMEVVSLGQARDVVTWSAKYYGNTKEIFAYKYKRLPQRGENSKNEAVFLCCNPSCPRAMAGEPIPATREFAAQDGENRIMMNQCDCSYQPRTPR